MRLPSRPLALLATFALHAASWAGPMPAAEADTGVSAAASAVVTPAGLSAQILGDDVTPSAASSPSGSALAAELIKESGAGVHATETPVHAWRAGGATAAASAKTTAGSAPPHRPTTAGDDWGLPEWGKATVHWLKQTVPWLRDDTDEHDSRTVAPDEADWSVSPLDRDARRSPHRPPDVSATAVANAAIRATPDSEAQPYIFDSEQNLIRMVVNTAREVLEHPMTWLVVLLFVIGAIVVKRIDRRPTK